MSGDPVDDSLGDALRAALAEQARRVPDRPELPDRIVAAALTTTPDEQPRSWRAWGLPAVAAAAVAAVVATALAVTSYRPDAAPPQRSTQASASSAAPSPHTTAPPSPSPSLRGSPTSVPTSAPETTAPPPARVPVLHGVHVIDLTFTGVDDGWALASADCLVGPGRCTAVLRTTDGSSWRGIPGARFDVVGVHGCTASCVEHLRFATDRIGYAYGPDVLFMTTDGGASWHRQPGRGADALESADGNVIRLVSDHDGCPGPCDVRVELAAVGATDWTRVALATAAVSGARVDLLRSRGNATVLVTAGGPAGAPPDARVFVSGDAGRHWADRADPCATAAAPATARTGTSQAVQGLDGSLTLLCTGYSGHPEWLATSTDGAVSFARRPAIPFAPAGYFLTIGALSRTTVFAADVSSLRRSTDGGASWRVVAHIPGFVTFLGFENDHVGRMAVDGGRSVWTTRDAGRTWTEVSLG